MSAGLKAAVRVPRFGWAWYPELTIHYSLPQTVGDDRP
jgi:hypothetical protein